MSKKKATNAKKIREKRSKKINKIVSKSKKDLDSNLEATNEKLEAEKNSPDFDPIDMRNYIFTDANLETKEIEKIVINELKDKK